MHIIYAIIATVVIVFFSGIRIVRTTNRGLIETMGKYTKYAEKYSIGNAQLLRKLQATETAIKNNAKIVIPSNSELINVIGDMSGVLPVTSTKER